MASPTQGQDAQNPLAVTWAMHRLAQAQGAGFLPPKFTDNVSGDPTAMWRAISAQIFGHQGAPAGMPQIQHPQLMDTPQQLFNPGQGGGGVTLHPAVSAFLHMLGGSSSSPLTQSLAAAHSTY